MKKLLLPMILVLILSLAACDTPAETNSDPGGNTPVITPTAEEPSAVGSYRYMYNHNGSDNQCTFTLHDDGRYWVICPSKQTAHTGTWEQEGDQIKLTSTCTEKCDHNYAHMELPGHDEGHYGNYKDGKVTITATKDGLIVHWTKEREDRTSNLYWFLARI